MISLAELHGLIVHLPLLAVPVFALLAVLRWRRRGGELVEQAEPWVFGAAVVGVVVAIVTGLTVFGTARTELRGSTQRLILIHLVVGVALGVLLLGLAAARRWYRAGRGTIAVSAVAALVLASAGGYIGGKMVFAQGVGVASGGQFAQSGRGATQVASGLAQGRSEVAVGRDAFRNGFRCASCHGLDATGGVGPPLAGGVELDRFRQVHARGLFPPRLVGDGMFRAVNAWLRTLPRRVD